MKSLKRNDNDPTLNIFRKIYVDRIIIIFQLLLVLVVAIDFTLGGVLPHHMSWLFAIIVLTTAILASIPVLPTQKILSLTLFIGVHLTVGAFLVYIAPLNSPYEFIAFLLLYFTGYWFGIRGFVVSLLTFTSVFVLAFLYQINEPSALDFYVLLLKCTIFALIGGILTRLHDADLSERRELIRVSREVSFEQQRLRSLINSMADAVIATDYEGQILVYNGAALDLLNTNAMLEYKPLREFLKTYTVKHKPLDLLELAKKSNRLIKRDDVVVETGGGEYMNLYVSVAQIHLNYGKGGEEGFILLLRDITKEKSVEEQRDEFISVVSHELRTPIAIAEANISTALLPNILADKAKLGDLLEQAHHNVLFLSDLVNDITTLAHAERGDLDAQIESVDIGLLVHEITSTNQLEAQKKNLEIKVDVAPDVPKIESNTYRIKEILQDFVTNAIKYTESGDIVVKVEPSKTGVRFSVTDTGVGISQSDQKHVFEKFWRSEDYRTRSHSGTGLGLYITKKLAERMHGKVGLISRLDKGSTFWLELPLKIETSKNR